ncbi:MAG: HAMP domain-containing sensor histidine kinase [Armatimonadetes bacterium]|nr:HAMP domain-containing sensor histidine kinase [Armatimonadota bacterium]
MPQITIDLSDEAHFLLQRWAEHEKLVLEDEAAQMMNRALAASLPEGLAQWLELRTPVTAIKGFVSTLLMDEDETMFAHSDRMEFLEIMDKECDKILNFLRVIRLERFPERFHAEPTSLQAVVEAVRDRALRSRYLKPTHRFALELGDNLPETFLTDEEGLVDVLGEFMDRAIEYSPEGGEVRLIVVTTVGGGLAFTIQDQGLGMTSEFLLKISQRLNAHQAPEQRDNRDERIIGRAEPSFYEEWAFARWHGGQFMVDSAGLGKGTTVTLTLPSLGAPSRKLADDPSYRKLVSSLRERCIAILADVERLTLQHAQFDDEARKTLAKAIQTECDALTALAQSLSRSDISAAGA